jgi:Family of unknown function (DUF5367)
MTTVAVSTPSRVAERLPLFIALGVLLWFVAAMMFRVLGPTLLIPGSATLLLVFAGSIPLGWIFLRLGLMLGQVPGRDALTAAAVMSAVAMALDALALTFVPVIYGLPTAQLLIVAALLLWGVAWILAFAYMQTQRAR